MSEENPEDGFNWQPVNPNGEQADENTQERINELKDALQQCQRDKENAEEQIADLREALAVKKAQLSNAKEELQAVEKDRQQLRERVETLETYVQEELETDGRDRVDGLDFS